MRRPHLPQAANGPSARGSERHASEIAAGLATIQAMGESLKTRLDANGSGDLATAMEALLAEVARLTALTGEPGVATFTRGSVLECETCGNTFVNQLAAVSEPRCRRCKGPAGKWRPAEP